MKKQINNGVYLVVDPSLNEEILLKKINIVLEENIAALQIWDNFSEDENNELLISKICDICHARNIPVLINNRWDFLNELPLDGIHFDEIPEDYEKIKTAIKKPFVSGLTCNNDLNQVKWAMENNFDYISFCSVFPSSTSNSCELVSFETIKKASEIVDFPIFLAGGIKPENMEKLIGLNYSGVAVVSGIMSAEDPKSAVKKYLDELKISKNEN